MLKTKIFRYTVYLLATAIIIGSIVEGFRPGTILKDRAPENEATEVSARRSFLATPQEYATVQQYSAPDIPFVEVYAADYDYKNRCKSIHYLTGQMVLSKPFEVHNIKITQAPGTPGGTTVSGGEGVIEYPLIATWKITSNYPLTLEQLKQVIPPPYGFIKAGWAQDKPYAPVATVTFQNCLPPPVKPTPQR